MQLQARLNGLRSTLWPDFQTLTAQSSCGCDTLTGPYHMWPSHGIDPVMHLLMLLTGFIWNNITNLKAQQSMHTSYSSLYNETYMHHNYHNITCSVHVEFYRFFRSNQGKENDTELNNIVIHLAFEPDPNKISYWGDCSAGTQNTLCMSFRSMPVGARCPLTAVPEQLPCLEMAHLLWLWKSLHFDHSLQLDATRSCTSHCSISKKNHIDEHMTKEN